MLVRSGVSMPMHPGRVLSGVSLFQSNLVGLRSMQGQQYAARTVQADAARQDGLPWGTPSPWVYPERDGAIKAQLSAVAATTAHAMGRGRVTGSVTATPTSDAHLKGVRYGSGSAVMALVTTAHLRARGNVAGTLSIGSRPTADDIAQAVWGARTDINLEEASMATQARKALTTGKFVALK